MRPKLEDFELSTGWKQLGYLFPKIFLELDDLKAMPKVMFLKNKLPFYKMGTILLSSNSRGNVALFMFVKFCHATHSS